MSHQQDKGPAPDNRKWEKFSVEELAASFLAKMGMMACGERVVTSEMKPQHYCLVCCCPCCLGPPCSANRRMNYYNMAKTFSGVLLVVLCLVFIAELFVGGLYPSPNIHAIADFPKANPSLGPSSEVLYLMGSTYGYGIKYRYQLWRFITPIFLHAGFLHLLGNGLFLIMMGLKLEQEWGWKTYIPLFFVAGIGGGVFSMAVHPNAIGVGASGALFGLIGGQLANIAMHWSQMEPLTRKSTLIQLVVFAVVWTILGFSIEFVDGFAHLGGMIAGFLWGLILWGPRHSHYPWVKKLSRPVGAVLLIVFLAINLGVFFGAATVCPLPSVLEPDFNPIHVGIECAEAFGAGGQ